MFIQFVTSYKNWITKIIEFQSKIKIIELPCFTFSVSYVNFFIQSLISLLYYIPHTCEENIHILILHCGLQSSIQIL